MSRARSIQLPDGNRYWFDMNRNGEKASPEQLELLATIETNCDLDDLLDGGITQGEVLARLRKALGHQPIPIDVLERRNRWRFERQTQPACRACGKIGDSTKHHFVNKWILRELANYTQKWADRSKNCIPLCIACHRDFHSRDNGSQSIVHLLNDDERAFAESALSTLAEERPKLLILLARGSDNVYEARLAKDWLEGHFKEEAPAVNIWRESVRAAI